VHAPIEEPLRRLVDIGKVFGSDAQQSSQSLCPCFVNGFATLRHIDKKGNGMCIVRGLSCEILVSSLFTKLLFEQIPLQGLVLRVALLKIAGVEIEAQA
jgi:hypothetical protein